MIFIGFLINETNNSAENEYAFRLACYCGHLKVAKWLLKIKPDINISVKNEWAFIVACCNGHLELAKWLLEIKPDINIIAGNEWAFRYSILIIKKWLAHYISYYDAKCLKTIRNINYCSSLFDLI